MGQMDINDATIEETDYNNFRGTTVTEMARPVDNKFYVTDEYNQDL